MTFHGKRNVTPRVARLITVCDTDQSWRELDELWQRIRWARAQTAFGTGQDAALSLGIKPGTYRTYERPKEEEGREPPLSEIQRIAKKFKVSWVWLASGEGSPTSELVADERIALVAQKANEIPADKRDDAWNAAISVLDSFRARR